MGKRFKLIFLSLVTLVSINVSARVVTFVEHNGIIYSQGYVSDFQVDGLFYTIQKDGIYVSAERYLFDTETGMEVVNYNAYKGEITIPETVTYGDTVYKVIGIDEAAFKWCYNLFRVVIPSSVEYIGASAFTFCTELKSINIPSCVSCIGKDAFYGCFSIDSLFWYTSYESPRKATGNCYNSLKYVLLGDEMTSIADYAFEGCGNISSITIPEKVEYIGRGAFSGCHNLNKIVIEGSPVIYEYSFSMCTIDSIIFKSRIPPTALDHTGTAYGWIDGFHEVFFEDCAYTDAQLLIPASSVGEYMSSRLWSFFKKINTYDDGYSESDFECDSINNTVNVGEDTIYYTVQECGDTIYYVVHEDGIHVVSKSFKSIGSGKTHGFDDPLTPRDPMAGGLQPRFGTRSGSGETIDTLDFKTYSGSVVIPESVPYKESIYTVTCIDKYAFAGSRDLVSVSLPESVRQLGYGCFAGCSGLTEITIPKSVRVIDEYAFAYCTGLKRVIIEGNPEIAETAFIGCGMDLEFVMTKVESNEAKDLDLQSNGAVHYSIDGRIIPADAPGLHVIKYKNGIVGKAWVR